MLRANARAQAHVDRMRGQLAAALIGVLIATPLFPCSTFLLVRDGEVVFGRTYDFEIGDGLVLINRRGLTKTSYAGSGLVPARHTARGDRGGRRARRIVTVRGPQAISLRCALTRRRSG